MTQTHPSAERLARYDELSGPEREALLRHAAECAACRRQVLAADASRAFAFLALEPLPDAALDRVSRAVRHVTEPRPAPARPRRLAWASIAASLLLAAGLGGLVWRSPHHEAGPPGGPPAQGAMTAKQVETLPAGVEVLAPAGADVYDLSVGDAQVVMIFEAGLDI